MRLIQMKLSKTHELSKKTMTIKEGGEEDVFNTTPNSTNHNNNNKVLNTNMH